MKFSSALISSLGLIIGGNASECPGKDSTDTCWTYSNVDGKEECTLQDRADCTSITCDATSLTLNYNPDILGVGKGAEIVTAGGTQTGTLNDEGTEYSLTCSYTDLSECGTTMMVDNDNDNLIFEVAITLPSDDGGSALSDLILKDANGNDVKIEQTQKGIGVTYRCKYSLTTSVTSRDFSVEAVSIDGVQESEGDLAGSFDLVLNGGSDDTIILGDDLRVEATWQLSNLPNMFFHLEDCTVKHGNADDAAAVNVFIIKNACYASALGATYLDVHSFQFRTFAVQSAVENEANQDPQTVSCTIRLCENDDSNSEQCNKREIKEAVCSGDEFYGDNKDQLELYQFTNVGDSVV